MQMDYEEGLAWLNGERSTVNMLQLPNDEQSHVRVAQADAAMMEQAYWIVRAHKEELVGVTDA